MPHITCENCGDKFYDSRKSCPNCSFERTDGKGKEVDVKSNTKKLFIGILKILIFIYALYRLIKPFVKFYWGTEI
ncbi:hypothetical protein [uncultured Tenacibaculum sp.]|uniref:hypothetical protein n=1 Tax=uncultured Tenacibaculum sp. TaxID=174713 RepID=UPI0026016D83|nr:hypothetical protein [uncultured Tenacibaculum sp.]